MYIFDFPICILFNCRKNQKLPKNDHFWVWRAVAAQGSPGSKNNVLEGTSPNYSWTNDSKISSIGSAKNAAALANQHGVRTGSIFGPGFTRVILVQSRQMRYQNFGHQMRYKRYFDHFPPNPLRKKLFAKNTFFNHLQKHPKKAIFEFGGP